MIRWLFWELASCSTRCNYNQGLFDGTRLLAQALQLSQCRDTGVSNNVWSAVSQLASRLLIRDQAKEMYREPAYRSQCSTQVCLFCFRSSGVHNTAPRTFYINIYSVKMSPHCTDNSIGVCLRVCVCVRGVRFVCGVCMVCVCVCGVCVLCECVVCVCCVSVLCVCGVWCVCVWCVWCVCVVCVCVVCVCGVCVVCVCVV